MDSRPVAPIGRYEARAMAKEILSVLNDHGRLVKSIHVMPKLHNGHLTIRVFMIPVAAEDPDPFIFTREEL